MVVDVMVSVEDCNGVRVGVPRFHRRLSRYPDEEIDAWYYLVPEVYCAILYPDGRVELKDTGYHVIDAVQCDDHCPLLFSGAAIKQIWEDYDGAGAKGYWFHKNGETTTAYVGVRVDTETGVPRVVQVVVQSLECEPTYPTKYWLAFPEKIVLDGELEELVQRFRWLAGCEQLSVQAVLRGVLEPSVRELYSVFQYYREMAYEEFRDGVFVRLRNDFFVVEWERWKGERGFRWSVKATFRQLIRRFNWNRFS